MIIGLSGKMQSGKNTVASIIQYLIYQDKTENPSLSLNSFLNNTFIGDSYSGFTQKSFAQKLKKSVSILTGIPVKDLEKQEVKDRLLGEEWNRTFYEIIDSDYNVLSKTFYKEDAELDLAYYEDYHHKTVELTEFQNRSITVRQLLQEVGTDAMRNIIHPNTWVNALFADYTSKKYSVGIDKYGHQTIVDKYPKWLITDLRFPNELQAVKDRGGITIRVNRLNSTNQDGHTYINKKDRTHPSELALDNAEFDYVIDNNGTIEELVIKVKEILIKESIV